MGGQVKGPLKSSGPSERALSHWGVQGGSSLAERRKPLKTADGYFFFQSCRYQEDLIINIASEIWWEWHPLSRIPREIDPSPMQHIFFGYPNLTCTKPFGYPNQSYPLLISTITNTTLDPNPNPNSYLSESVLDRINVCNHKERFRLQVNLIINIFLAKISWW